MADHLTQRERDVLSLIADGLACKSIAARLGISEQTVRKHRRRLLRKTGASNAAALCTTASQLAQLPPKRSYLRAQRFRNPLCPRES
ncbi:helix-turn-helix transcriptional regulator [Paraburkholderia sp. SIMBA_049]